jgi:hypothetical protein
MVETEKHVQGISTGEDFLCGMFKSNAEPYAAHTAAVPFQDEKVGKIVVCWIVHR